MCDLVLTLDDPKLAGWNDIVDGHHPRSISTAKYAGYEKPQHVLAISYAITVSYAELKTHGCLNSESILADASHRCGLGPRALQGFLNKDEWIACIPSERKDEALSYARKAAADRKTKH